MNIEKEDKTDQRAMLVAEDGAELLVVSSMLQDALIATEDMKWLEKEQRFVMLLNRFCWEKMNDKPPYYRSESGVTFQNITRVQHRNLNRARIGVLHNLLGLRIEDSAHIQQDQQDQQDQQAQQNQNDQQNKSNMNLGSEASREPIIIELIFSDHACIRLQCDKIEVRLKDNGQPWETEICPQHHFNDEGDAQFSKNQEIH